MQLLVDIGNTRIKAKVYTADQGFAADTLISESLDEVLSQIKTEPQVVWVSSVRHQDEQSIMQAINKRFAIPVQFAQVSETCAGIQTQYGEGLGIDRFLAMIAAWNQVRAACIVVDCGTAVTVDLLDHQGVHHGGVILPGLKALETTLYACTQGTQSSRPGKFVLFPLTTEDATHTGCRLTWQAGIEAVCRLMKKQIPDSQLLVSGGDGNIFTRATQKGQYVPDLVLQGLHLYASAHGSQPDASA